MGKENRDSTVSRCNRASQTGEKRGILAYRRDQWEKKQEDKGTGSGDLGREKELEDRRPPTNEKGFVVDAVSDKRFSKDLTRAWRPGQRRS